MASNPLCLTAIHTDPDVNTAHAWEVHAGLQRNEAVALSAGLPWAAGHCLQITDILQNPDRARGKYRNVDLLVARPAQVSDDGPFVLALQDSAQDGDQATVVLVGHIRAEASAWAPGTFLYVASNGALEDTGTMAVAQVVSSTGIFFFGRTTNA